jgi:hypothetical protein
MNMTISRYNLTNKSYLASDESGSQKNGQILKIINELYFVKKYSSMTFKLHVTMFVILYNYYFVLFNIGNLNGNIITIGILAGISECLGIIFGEPFIKLLPDWIGFQISMSIVILTTVCL